MPFTAMSGLPISICYEHGKPLPVQNGFIILTAPWQSGKVLSVQSGQKFVILSRVFEGGAN